jgi:predicted ATPase/class 3 adenylate cyclase
MSDCLPTGTVTFLYSDIEGSATLWEREPDQMRAACARHDEIMHTSIAGHGGRVFKVIGDAFQAAFSITRQALAAGLAAQRALSAEAWPTSSPIRVRIGLHVGPAEASGVDYTTTHTLNRVARIMSAGHGGQVLLSEPVASLVRGDLPVEVSLRDLGHHRMKGLSQPERLFQLVAPGLPAEFPRLNTLSLAASNLPTALTPFIGRQVELDAARKLLSQSRLLTLVGAGGCGKSRLALQLAGEVQSAYRDGVWLVELAPLADPALVPTTVSRVVGVQEDPARPCLESLQEQLRDRALLLVLDNCEHVIVACAGLSEALLRTCPSLHILASSREALGIAGEHTYRVPSLAAPDPAHLPPIEHLAQLDAIRLFVERAATARAGFALTAQNASAIAQICQRLDGMPLAIELAAARVKVLSVEQIAARLDDRFRLLTGGNRTALPRQQTLRAMIDWSYSLLSEADRLLFRRLAVFVNGWTLEAAEEVCAGDGLDAGEILDALTRLVDKSLVTTNELGDATRYRRLETIRQYARDRFIETDEVEAVRNRHLEFYERFAEQAGQQVGLNLHADWTRRIEAERDNIRAALEWGVALRPLNALRIAASLSLFWSASGHAVEGHRWMQQALDRCQALPPEVRATPEYTRALAHGLFGLAQLTMTHGRNAEALAQAEQSVALYRQVGDQQGLGQALVMVGRAMEWLGQQDAAVPILHEGLELARANGSLAAGLLALFSLGRLATARGEFDLARRYVEETVEWAHETGVNWQSGVAAEALGRLAAFQGRYEEARAQFERALPILREIGASFNIILTRTEIAHLERRQGNYAAALELYHETIVAFHQVGQHGAVAHQLECIAFIAHAQANLQPAIRLLAAASRLRETSRTPMVPEERPEYDDNVARLRAALDPAAFDALWAKGRGLSELQAIELALQT